MLAAEAMVQNVCIIGPSISINCFYHKHSRDGVTVDRKCLEIKN